MDGTNKILETALLAGTILMESNAEAYRTEETMNYILQTSNYYKYSSVALTTAIFVMVYDNETGERRTAIERIRSRENNLNTIATVNDISRKYISGVISVDKAYSDLLNLRINQKVYPSWMVMASNIGIAVLFTILFNGGYKDVLASFFTGCALVISQQITSRINLRSGLTLLINSFAISITAYTLSRFFIDGMSIAVVTLATLMPIVPGITIITALRDIFREDFLSGTARLVDTIYQSLMIALGTIIVYFLMGVVL